MASYLLWMRLDVWPRARARGTRLYDNLLGKNECRLPIKNPLSLSVPKWMWTWFGCPNKMNWRRFVSDAKKVVPKKEQHQIGCLVLLLLKNDRILILVLVFSADWPVLECVCKLKRWNISNRIYFGCHFSRRLWVTLALFGALGFCNVSVEKKMSLKWNRSKTSSAMLNGASAFAHEFISYSHCVSAFWCGPLDCNMSAPRT